MLYRQRVQIDMHQLVGFMQDIHAAFPQAKQIYVIQDNWHQVHFHQTKVAIAKQCGINLLPLTVYDPALNQIKSLDVNYARILGILHRQSDDWPRLKQRVCSFLNQFENGSSELLKSVGLPV